MARRFWLTVIAVPVATLAASPLLLRQSAGEPPDELVKNPLPIASEVKAITSDLKRSWFNWSTLNRTVTIKRRERETVTSPEVQQLQELSASYYILDARSRCSGSHEILDMAVAGVYPLGMGTIEKWHFVYPGSIGGYVPLDERPLPNVSRSVVYQGTQLGHIRALEYDPEGRFVLCLTYENTALYKISLPNGVPVVILSQASVPQLAGTGQLWVDEHVVEGRKYIIYHGPRWQELYGQTDPMIMLSDPNNDGTFDSTEVLDPATWHTRGYDMAVNWHTPCRD